MSRNGPEQHPDLPDDCPVINWDFARDGDEDWAVILTVADEEIPDYAALTLRVGAGREALKDAGDAIKHRAYQAVVDALRAKTEDGQVRLARGVLLVTARA